MSTTSPDTDTESDRTFDQFLEFLNHLDNQTLVRLVVDPDEPLRGQDSHEASVFDIHPIDSDGEKLPDDADEEQHAATRYTFKADHLSETGISDNYERETVHYRFTVPTGPELSKTNIELEANYNPGIWEETTWQDAGYLIGGGVMVYYE